MWLCTSTTIPHEYDLFSRWKNRKWKSSKIQWSGSIVGQCTAFIRICICILYPRPHPNACIRYLVSVLLLLGPDCVCCLFMAQMNWHLSNTFGVPALRRISLAPSTQHPAPSSHPPLRFPVIFCPIYPPGCSFSLQNRRRVGCLLVCCFVFCVLGCLAVSLRGFWQCIEPEICRYANEFLSLCPCVVCRFVLCAYKCATQLPVSSSRPVTFSARGIMGQSHDGKPNCWPIPLFNSFRLPASKVTRWARYATTINVLLFIDFSTLSGPLLTNLSQQFSPET